MDDGGGRQAASQAMGTAIQVPKRVNRQGESSGSSGVYVCIYFTFSVLDSYSSKDSHVQCNSEVLYKTLYTEI